MAGKAAEAVKAIEQYIDSCLIRGTCADCPFYVEGRDYLSGKCMGAKQYGMLLRGMLVDIKKELENGKRKKS